MKIIAHRGNLYGPNQETENTIEHAEKCFALGFDVELDVWYMENGQWFFGHDEPRTKIEWRWLHQNMGNLWLHVKNPRTAQMLCGRLYNFNAFAHEKDPFCLTSHGDLWFYPGTEIKYGPIDYYSIVACLPEIAPDWDLNHATHICTDYPVRYAEQYAEGK